MKSKLAAVAAIGMLGLLFPGGPGAPERAEAAFPGDNGKVVFELSCVDDFECETSDNGIFEVTDEGIARLTSDPGDQSPAWSSDGEWLAFSRCDDIDCDIWMARADGSEETQVTDDSSSNEWEPSWAPGANKVVFRSCPVNSGPNSCELWVVDLDAVSATMLTDNARLEQDPAWAPNGRRLNFEAGKCKNNPVGQPHCTYKNPPQIYKLNPNSEVKAEKITHMEKGARDPNYSPGGRRIVFNDDGGRLFTISPKGTGLRKFGLAGSDGINDADYSPNALFLIMTVYIGDEAGIYTWNLENDETESLFEHPYLWPDSPAWQPVP
jgi:Tol biopolymer transport system component